MNEQVKELHVASNNNENNEKSILEEITIKVN